jgi:hypothetical protein
MGGIYDGKEIDIQEGENKQSSEGHNDARSD